MRWTIGKQIFVGYTVSLLALLVLGFIAFRVSRDLLEAFEERRIANLTLASADTALLLLQDAETGQRGFVITGVESYLDPHERAVSLLPNALAELRQLINAQGADRSRFEELQGKINDKLKELDETIALRRAQGFEAAQKVVVSDQGKRDMDRIREILSAIKSSRSEAVERINQRAQREAENFTIVLFAGIPLCGVIMLVIGVVTARGIAHPVNEIAIAAEQIRAGNLNVEVPLGSSAREIRTLARAFSDMVAALRQSANLSKRIAAGDLTVEVRPQSEADVVGNSQAEMVGKLSELIEHVQRSGVQVNSSAVQIAATSKQQQSTATEMASTTTEISTTAREMSATSTELLKAADNVNAISQQMAGLAVGGKEGLSRMEQIMRQIMEASSSITSRLGEMNEKAGNIGSVVTTITKVADQTNLLSLNAAIEAEKAGEYGRGFAVVASEIRRLADQTAASTLDIEQMVKEMLGSVSAGVMGMDKFSEEVRRSAREVGEVSRQIDQVIEQAQSLAPSVESVYEGMRAQTQGATQISDALAQLGEAARQTADAVRDSNRAVEQLNDATHGLQNAISRFKLK